MSENLNDLEMAKKRDHKIMITDEAINKVPFVQYKEIPETEYDNLRELAGRDSARQPIILYRACISIAPMS